MSSCSLSYLGGVFDRAATISCGSDAVTDLVTGWIITPLPHNIAQLLTPPHLNCNHLFVIDLLLLSSLLFRHYHPFLLFYFYFHPWKCGLLSAFMRVLLCPLRKRVTNPRLLWQSLWILWKLQSTVWYSWVADGQMMLGSLVDQGIAHPWLSYGLKMLWLCGRRWWCSHLRLGIFISRGRHPGTPVNLFFNAVPPRCCLLLFFVGGHRCAASMSAGNNMASKMLTLQI